jgi:hypothetical protein
MNTVMIRLKKEGTLRGHVSPFARYGTAMGNIERNPGRVIMRVDEFPCHNCGTYWVMDAEDAQRMRDAGYLEHPDSIALRESRAVVTDAVAAAD